METLDQVLDVPYSVSFAYIKMVEGRIDLLAKEWGEPVVVKFGTTGQMRIPNFQIESECGEKIQAFKNELGKFVEQTYDDNKLTRAFTRAEYKQFLKEKLNR